MSDRRVSINELYLDAVGDAIRYANGSGNTYTPAQFENAIKDLKKVLVPLTANDNGEYDPDDYDADGFSGVTVYVQGGGSAVLIEKTINANGTYLASSDNADGFSKVNVSVQENVVLSGTVVPTSDIGQNEDLYVKYSVAVESNHTYKIDNIYRKENGTWAIYSDPVFYHGGIHIWTQSTGGNDASINIQYGYYSMQTSTFVPTGVIVNLLYSNAKSQAINFNNIASVRYGYVTNTKWAAWALTGLTDGNNNYSSNDEIKNWAYNESVDFVVWIP